MLSGNSWEERWRRKKNEGSEKCTKRRCKSYASDAHGHCPTTTPPEKAPITILASSPQSPLTACPSKPLPPRATPKVRKTTPLCSPFSISPRRHRHRRRRRRHRSRRHLRHRSRRHLRRRLPLFPNTFSPFPLSLLSLSLRFATRLLVPFPPFSTCYYFDCSTWCCIFCIWWWLSCV